MPFTETKNSLLKDKNEYLLPKIKQRKNNEFGKENHFFFLHIHFEFKTIKNKLKKIKLKKWTLKN